MGKLYTIGYATKDIDQFVDILRKNSINCLVDVRTIPYSKQFPDYNTLNLRKTLSNYGIKYGEFGKYFGARRDEQDVYDRIKFYDDSVFDIVIFKKVYKLDIFIDGVDRIINGLKQNYNIAFLCSEKYPYDCHRCIMVANYFTNKGYVVEHIVDNQNILSTIDVDEYIERNFDNNKRKFINLRYDEIKEQQYAGGLFQLDIVDDNLTYWMDFFSNYTREKGYYLRNLEIGYKRGNDYDD